jgi:uncharacterized protein with PIN domain
MDVEDASDESGERFLVDLMLMRLGRWLRLLGRDVANPEGESDSGLMDQAKREIRTIITRDRKLSLACRKHELSCIFIRSSFIEEQLVEMAGAGVALRLDPQRCTICNGPLGEMKGYETKIWRCRICNRVYWQGSHWEKMEGMLVEICRRREEDCHTLAERGPEDLTALQPASTIRPKTGL